MTDTRPSRVEEWKADFSQIIDVATGKRGVLDKRHEYPRVVFMVRTLEVAMLAVILWQTFTIASYVHELVALESQR